MKDCDDNESQFMVMIGMNFIVSSLTLLSILHLTRDLLTYQLSIVWGMPGFHVSLPQQGECGWTC